MARLAPPFPWPSVIDLDWIVVSLNRALPARFKMCGQGDRVIGGYDVNFAKTCKESKRFVGVEISMVHLCTEHNCSSTGSGPERTVRGGAPAGASGLTPSVGSR